MTPAELAAIADRCEKATPGPWENCGTHDFYSPTKDHSESLGFIASRLDREFVAHARADVPALLAEVERLGKELSLWRQVPDAIEEMQGTSLNENNYPLAVTASWSLLHMKNARLREALTFYSKGEHFSDDGCDATECKAHSEPETVSGEPPNWECGHGDYTVENGGIARATLEGK